MSVSLKMWNVIDIIFVGSHQRLSLVLIFSDVYLSAQRSLDFSKVN